MAISTWAISITALVLGTSVQARNTYTLERHKIKYFDNKTKHQILTAMTSAKPEITQFRI